MNLAYLDKHSGGLKEEKGLMVVCLRKDNQELGLVEEDYVFCINQPHLNYNYTEYASNGIGYLLVERVDNEEFGYDIMKVLDGRSMSFKEAMSFNDNTLVFVDEYTYVDWWNKALPKSGYDISAFKSKIFQSVDFMRNEKFKMYPIIGFIRNLTKRIEVELLRKMKLEEAKKRAKAQKERLDELTKE